MNRSAPFPGSNLKVRPDAKATADFMSNLRAEQKQRIADFETFIVTAEGNPHMARHVERARQEIECLRRASGG
jgi:hypothetical protein